MDDADAVVDATTAEAVDVAVAAETTLAVTVTVIPGCYPIMQLSIIIGCVKRKDGTITYGASVSYTQRPTKWSWSGNTVPKEAGQSNENS